MTTSTLRPDDRTADLGPGVATYEFGGRSLRIRLITIGVSALLVIGATTALVAVAAAYWADRGRGRIRTVRHPSLWRQLIGQAPGPWRRE